MACKLSQMIGGLWRTDSTSARQSTDSFLEMTLLPVEPRVKGKVDKWQHKGLRNKLYQREAHPNKRETAEK